MFKFVNRGRAENLIVLGGWAFDERIFERLDVPYNYFLFSGQYGNGFAGELVKLLEDNGLEKVSLFGWSQGAFEAGEFACDNPERIEELILVSLRKRYDAAAVEKVKEYLLRNKEVFLRRFYDSCFCKGEAEYRQWFKDNLRDDYLSDMSIESLINGLDRLVEAEIRAVELGKLKNVKIVHGKNDRIVTYREAVSVCKKVGRAELIIIDGAGHIPFLREDFSERLYEC